MKIKLSSIFVVTYCILGIASTSARANTEEFQTESAKPIIVAQDSVMDAEAEINNPYNKLRSAGIDLGYGDLPKKFIDINGDGTGDYCRFVGNAPNIFIACAIKSRNYSWSAANQFSFRSINGIDPGYDTLPRGFRVVNGRGAYCRFVGNAPNIFEACNLTTSTGFLPDQFGYRTGRTRSSAVAR